jgi:AcrR family transcriptional regulator
MSPSSGTTTSQPRTRPLRRDAELNLARILAAATDVFAESGYEASMEHIAERAGVGVGTLYRRFPGKADLVTAVVEAANRRTEEIAREVLDGSAAEDGVFDFLRRCVAAPSCWRVIASRAPGIGNAPRAGVSRIEPLVDEVLTRAKKAGAVRDDVAFTDLAVALMSVRAVADLFDPYVPATSGRYLDVVLAGLRPNGQPLGSTPMTTAQLGRVLTGG